MKLYAKSISLMIVALFLGSIALTIVTENSDISASYLTEKPTVSEAQSPGHTVFAEYVGAHWCGPCHGASNALRPLCDQWSPAPSQRIILTFPFINLHHRDGLVTAQ